MGRRLHNDHRVEVGVADYVTEPCIASHDMIHDVVMSDGAVSNSARECFDTTYFRYSKYSLTPVVPEAVRGIASSSVGPIFAIPDAHGNAI